MRVLPPSMLHVLERGVMLDLVFLLLGLGGFGLMVGYAWACNRL